MTIAKTEPFTAVMEKYLNPSNIVALPKATEAKWLQGLRTPKGRLAVIWIGWFLIAHFAIFWFLRSTDSASTVDIANVVILLLLGHGVVLIGVGLSSVELIEKINRQNAAISQLVVSFAALDRRSATPKMAVSETDCRSIATGEINGRALKVRLDGTVEVQTLLGPRRFRHVADAVNFVGVDQKH